MILSIATSRERTQCFALSSLLGTVFAFGFLPTARDLGVFLVLPFLGASGAGDMGIYLGFPLLAGFFAFSLSSPDTKSPWFDGLWRRSSLLVPMALAAAFGLLHPSPGLWDARSWDEIRPFLWIMVCVPLSEEFLFRGWTFHLIERLWPARLLTVTNPLPLSVWGSSLAFSLWHLQNFTSQSIGWTLFQCVYTLVLGLWLGALRYWSGSLRWPIAAHTAINAASSIW